MTSTKATPKAPGFDWAEINAKIEADRKAAAEARKIERKALLDELRGRGVSALEACYDGYGDSGNVNGIAVTPEEAKIDDLREPLENFVWDTAYDRHPGFEINDGGEGTLTWNIEADRIDLDHTAFYTGREEHLHEDI